MRTCHFYALTPLHARSPVRTRQRPLTRAAPHNAAHTHWEWIRRSPPPGDNLTRPSAVGDTRGGAASRRKSARRSEQSTQERVMRTRKDPSSQPSATAAWRGGLWASMGVAVSVRGAGSVSLTCQRTLIACACFSLQDETGRLRPCEPCRQRRQWR